MCGRFTLTPDAERLFEEYGIGVPADYSPRWNIAPGQPILALAGAEPRAGWLHWGLVPHWGTHRRPYVNLRVERLEQTVPRLLERRRCAIPADGFYEWQRQADGKQPFYVHQPDGLFTMAAVWDRPRGEDASPTVAILTTAATGRMKQIHARMPIVLDAEAQARWLADGPWHVPDTAEAAARIAAMDIWPVSTHVNNVRNDDPACTEPLI